MKEDNTFEYTYSAKRQEEVEAIRRKYESGPEDKMEQLRKLDRDAEKPGIITAVTVGLIGVMIFGAGMSCSLVWTETLMVPGILLGILGIAVMAAALPVYRLVTKKQREKIAPQILALSDELLK